MSQFPMNVRTSENNVLRRICIAVLIMSPIVYSLGCSENGKVGTSQEISHTETNKNGWFGGHTHEVNTVYKNSDGSTSVETESTHTDNGTTTITRTKTTTNVDGTVKTDHETRTIVAGSESSSSDSHTTK